MAILKQILVDRYLPREIFEKLNPQTQRVLIVSFTQDFKQDMIAEFGSLYNYEKWRVRRNGFKSVSEYRGCLIKEVNGFSSFWEYRKSLTIKKGLCPMCWNKKPKDNFVNCENCREKRRIQNRERYRKHHTPNKIGEVKELTT